MRCHRTMPALATSILCAATMFAGCSDGTAPNDAGPGDLDTSGGREQVEFALRFLDGLVTSVNDLAEGELQDAFVQAAINPQSEIIDSIARSQCFDAIACADVVPVYSGGRWQALCRIEEPDCHVSYDFLVEYLEGAEPQRFPNQSTTKVVAATVIEAGFTTEVSTYEMRYENEMEVLELRSFVHRLTGSGGMAGTVSGMVDDHETQEHFEMSWTYSLEVPSGTVCATGAVVMSLETDAGVFAVTATYDGTAAYEIVMSRGSQEIYRDVRPSVCTEAAGDRAAIDEAEFVVMNVDFLLEVADGFNLSSAPGTIMSILERLDRTGRPVLRGICPGGCYGPIVLRWSESEEAWLGRCRSSSFLCDTTLLYAFRYRALDGRSQRIPDETTVGVEFDIEVDTRLYAPLDSEGNFAEFKQDLESEIDVDLTQIPFAVTGSGSNRFTVEKVSDDVLVEEINTDWTLAVTMPLAGGCVSGAVNLNVGLASGTYDATCMYDGSDSITWHVARGGEIIHSESVTPSCAFE